MFSQLRSEEAQHRGAERPVLQYNSDGSHAEPDAEPIRVPDAEPIRFTDAGAHAVPDAIAGWRAGQDRPRVHVVGRVDGRQRQLAVVHRQVPHHERVQLLYLGAEWYRQGWGMLVGEDGFRSMPRRVASQSVQFLQAHKQQQPSRQRQRQRRWRQLRRRRRRRVRRLLSSGFGIFNDQHYQSGAVSSVHHECK